MVTQALSAALRVSGTVAAIIQALESIDRARKDIGKLRKLGLVTQANRLEAKCNAAERRIKSSLTKQLAREARQRATARRQSRSTSGRFS